MTPDDLLKWLDGKKTFIGAAGFALLALYQFAEGHTDQALQSLLAALTALGLRSAVAKLGT